jgi:hypothetical protein
LIHLGLLHVWKNCSPSKHSKLLSIPSKFPIKGVCFLCVENMSKNLQKRSNNRFLKESPLGADHLQKVSFAASNHMVTHNQAYFDKINSKIPNKLKQKPNHPPAPATSKQPATLNPPANSLATVGHHFRPNNSGDFFISGQTQPKNIEKHNSTSKIDSNASKIDYNASKLFFFFYSNLKPRGEG